MENVWYNTPSVTDNKYMYNGKEYNDDFGLNMNDYGARFYDPAILRWSTFDPMAERDMDYTPYNYVTNNPMRFIGPNGMYSTDGTTSSNTSALSTDGSLVGGGGPKEVRNAQVVNLADGKIVLDENDVSGNLAVINEPEFDKKTDGKGIKNLNQAKSMTGFEIVAIAFKWIASNATALDFIHSQVTAAGFDKDMFCNIQIGSSSKLGPSSAGFIFASFNSDQTKLFAEAPGTVDFFVGNTSYLTNAHLLRYVLGHEKVHIAQWKNLIAQGGLNGIANPYKSAAAAVSAWEGEAYRVEAFTLYPRIMNKVGTLNFVSDDTRKGYTKYHGSNNLPEYLKK